MSSGIRSAQPAVGARPEVGARPGAGDDRSVAPGAIPAQRTAADAYRVSEDQLHNARMVVARNCADSDDLRQLLDMLGLISANPDLPPPVRR